MSDTFGRPWRRGLTDVAIGCAGIGAILDLRGGVDALGRELKVTEVAVVDELAGAAELVMGKSRRHPVAVVRGVDPCVAPPGRGALRARPPAGGRPLPLSPPPNQSSTASIASGGVEPAQGGGHALGHVGPRLPAELDAGPARVERRASQLAGAAPARTRRRRRASGLGHRAVERLTDVSVPVPMFIKQPATPLGGPDERVDHVVDEHEVAGLLAGAEDGAAQPARSRPAKIATTPASPCGSWRGP